MRLANKVAIVTGGGSGFGEGIARRFAAEGAAVAIGDLNLAGAERVAGEITRAGGKALPVAADVTSNKQMKALVDAAVKAFGGLDIFVNNAGMPQRNAPLLNTDEETFDRIFAVNVKSIYLSAIHAVPEMRKRKGGCFINIASTAGVRPRPGLTWYNGSKGAVITTSKSLAAELGPDNIRVNCVNPVMNPFTGLGASFAGGELTEERLGKFRSTIPLGRFSTALDVANAVLYLASDEAAFISGVCLEVDGARCV